MNLDDRMKLYEKAQQISFTPLLPIMARIDGKAFHTYTRGMDKPFDIHLVDTMRETTRFLVQESGASFGYTQSDEITLCFVQDSLEQQHIFNGKPHKLTSVLASLATGKFNQLINKKELAFFDCRVWQMPNKIEATNCFLWRYTDAIKNSVSMQAYAYFSHKECLNKNTKQKLEMLEGIGRPWIILPDKFRFGSLFTKEKVMRKFTTEELALLPPKHLARTNPNLTFERSDIIEKKSLLNDMFNMQMSTDDIQNRLYR